MPHPDEIPGRALEIVADQIGRLLPRLLGTPPPSTPEFTITDSLSVWKLSSDRIGDSSDVLLRLAVATERWHHQIEVEGRPEVFARSAPDPDHDPTSWRVREVTRSPVVAKLDATIDRIDAEVPEDELVRLLEAPAYALRALWLIGSQDQSRVLVVDAANRLGDLFEMGLQSESEFLDQLGRVTPVVGIELEDEGRPQTPDT